MEQEQVIRAEEAEVVPDGLRWLRLLGPEYEALADKPTGYVVGEEAILVRDFDRLCGEHARPLFIGLESIGEQDPRFPAFQEVARSMFDAHFRPKENQ